MNSTTFFTGKFIHYKYSTIESIVPTAKVMQGFVVSRTVSTRCQEKNRRGSTAVSPQYTLVAFF